MENFRVYKTSSSFSKGKIKRIVQDLVFQKFGEEFSRKSINPRRSLRFKGTPNSSSFDEESFLKTALGSQYFSAESFMIPSPHSSDNLSVGTGDISVLVSNKAEDNEKTCYHGLDETTQKYQKLITVNNTHYQLLRAIQEDEVHSRGNLSVARIEAEKLLEITLLEKKRLLKDLETPLLDPDQTKNAGTISMENLHVRMEKDRTCSNRYFFCVLDFGSTTYVTEIFEASNREKLNFNGEFVFDNLPPNYAIDVTIYELPIKKKSSNLSCHCIKPKCGGSLGSSLFKPIATTTIRGCTFFKPLVVLCSRAGGCRLYATLSGTVNINMNVSGLLDISLYYGKCPVWQKFWCRLVGTELRYWNYPVEELYDDPVGTIDLTDHVYLLLPSVEETFLRKGTIILRKPTSDSYVLSASAPEDYIRWKSALGAVISAVHSWQQNGYTF